MAYDPWADPKLAKDVYGIDLLNAITCNDYAGVMITVAHSDFKTMGIERIRSHCKEGAIIYDLKHIFDRDDVDLRL